MIDYNVIEHTPEEAQYSDKFIKIQAPMVDLQDAMMAISEEWDKEGIEYFSAEITIAADGSSGVASISGWKEEPEGFEEKIERQLCDRETGEVIKSETLPHNKIEMETKDNG